MGKLLDRYEIGDKLGHGAMGEVFRARDPKLDRTVAIKTVSLSALDPDAEQEFRKRFVVEAQAAGRLSHPGIVTIFDVREDPEPFLVMEYVEGQSLQQLISRENRILPVSTTLRLIQEVAEALHYAHAQGVVHRDIKPANILVTADGHPKIADFGVAKLNQTDLTLPGQVLGSPAFMAPEQLCEEGVDARSDLFSLGVILYYMLTGHRPFQGNSTTTVCFKLVNHEPLPVSAFESKLSPEIDKIVSRAMAKDPAQRYQSGAAMASDIQALREGNGFVHKGLDIKGTDPAQGNPGRAVAGRDGRLHEAKPTMAVLVFSLLAVALAGATFLSVHSPRRPGADSTSPATIPDLNDGEQGNEGGIESKGALTPAAQPRIKVASAASGSAASTTAKHAIPASAILQIEIEHHFASATASVWLDDHLIYTQSLHGEKQRRAFVFRKVAGRQFDAIKVPAGKHLVRVRVHSKADSYDQSKIIANATFQGASLLRVVCGDKGEGLQLALQKDPPAF